jgi:hypothetical protein
MATVTPTFSRDVGTRDASIVLLTWVLLTANTDGSPFEMPEWADRTWQAQGTWGGATLTFQGSNDGANWFTLSNAAGGTAATLTANGGLATIELPRYVRPNLTVAGTGATVNVTLCARRATPMRN